MKNIWEFLGLTQDTIGRGRYIIANFTVGVVPITIVSLLTALSINLFGDKSVILYFVIVLFIASFVFELVVHIKTSIRRVRDIGIAQSWWVLAIIPFVNIPFVIFLCLKKGGAGNGHFSLRNNAFMEQFRRFFSYEYSKPFMIICFGVIMAGAVIAGYAVSDLKGDIEIKIAQREEELDKLFDAKMENYEKCVHSLKNPSPTYFIKEMMCGSEPYKFPTAGLNDALYNELSHIKNTSSFQLFFENFGFGWWGIIALVAVFLINILIVLFKFFTKYVPFIFKTGNVQAKSIKTNVRSMPAFQRYLLLIALLILIALVFILMKL
ncbi:MAG TPA: DUF805 domain-containing protein [Candidatus Paceibacterota bacterium]